MMVVPVPRLLQHCNGAPILKRLVNQPRTCYCMRGNTLLPAGLTCSKPGPSNLQEKLSQPWSYSLPSLQPAESLTYPLSSTRVTTRVTNCRTTLPPFETTPFETRHCHESTETVGSPERRPAWEQNRQRHPLPTTPHPRSTTLDVAITASLGCLGALATDVPYTHSKRTTCEMQALRLARLRCCIASQTP